MPTSIYSFENKKIDGSSESLSVYRNQVLLLVNTASQCGFTAQYQGLEMLQKKYHGQGFSVLAFPCNQFGGQEPGTNTEIAAFCQTNYQTTFPVFAKIKVNGPQATPLFKYLKQERPGLLGSQIIKWNFTKFLVDRQGFVVARFAPNTPPEEIAPSIESLL